MRWLRTMWHSVLDIIGVPVRTEADSGDPRTDRYSGTISQRGIDMDEIPLGDRWLVTRIEGSDKEIWGTTMHLKGTGRAASLRITLTGLWLSKFKAPMFLNQRVQLKDELGYIVVYYVDYPILKAVASTADSASG